MFADLISFHLDAVEQLETTSASLADVRAVAELREQFIAILGHDLRNPIASVQAGVQLLERMGGDDKQRSILQQIHKSVVRMGTLVDNVLDFARGRLGGGMQLVRSSDRPLGPILEHLTDELRTLHPQRTITTDFNFSTPVDCEPDRIAQLYSNLLANALTHGAEQGEITARVSVADGAFELSVANPGRADPAGNPEADFRAVCARTDLTVAAGSWLGPLYRVGDRPCP